MQSLEGVRVLDLTQHLSGPYCTMVLGDMGADILKIEKLKEGDDQRKLGPFVNGEGAPFMTINRNKRSITLNLKAAEGRAIFLKMAKSADVIVENFRPGIVKSLGIDYESVKAINPGVIYCSISGYGQTGPYCQKGGYDLMAQGMSGIMDMNSEPGRPPRKLPVSIFDIGAGTTSVSSILSAYIHKLKTGDGQYIDVSLVEAGLALTVIEATAYFVNGVVPKIAGTRNHLSAPYQAYRAKDGYVLVGAGNQRLWEKFCQQVVHKPEWLGDARFESVSSRHRHADELEQLMEEVLMREDRSHWVARMDAEGIPGGPINTFDQTLNDPHVLARDMVLEIEHPRAGKIRTIGVPAKMSGTPGRIRRPAPMLGQHTDEVLKEVLALSDEEISRLRAASVI